MNEECERQEIEADDYRFTRRTVRQHTRWGDTQLRVHLRRLEELEYLSVRRGGPGPDLCLSAPDERKRVVRRRLRGAGEPTSRG